MIWDVLKIEATKDKRAITRAYRDLLSSVNPEEKPEEFKLLRSAYEEAIRLAEQEESDSADQEKNPVAGWLKRVDQVYGELDKRMNPDCWSELLTEDVCVRLDTRHEAEEALLKYFYEHFRIPHAIWLLLDKTFDLRERREELLAEYPESFVRYVILKGICEEDSVPYSLFPPASSGESVDAYLQTFYEAAGTEFTEAAPIFEKLAALPITHPYGEALRCRYDYFCEDASALPRLEALHQQYPEDTHIGGDLLLLYHYSENYALAEALAKALLEKEPEQGSARQVLAYALAGQENYREAVEQINRLMAQTEGNQRRLYELDEIRRQWNDALIEQYNSRLTEDPEDAEAAFDLVWCYLQNDRTEEIIARVPLLQKDYPTRAKYLRLRYLTLFSCNQWEQALAVAEEFLRLSDSDQDEEDKQKRKEHISDLLMRKCSVLLAHDRPEEGLAALNEVLALCPDNADIQTKACQLYYQMERFGQAKDHAEKIIRLAPGSYHGYLWKALVCYQAQQDSEAYSAINRALELDGSDLYAYQLKLFILTRNNAFDAAEQLIAFLEENGIQDDTAVQWCRARMAESKDNDRQKAWEMYETLEAKLSADEEKPDWIGEFYFHMALLKADIKDAEEDYSRDDLLALLDKGLAFNPRHYKCLEYKGWLLKKEEKTEQALAVFHQLEERPRSSLYVEKQLAELYYEKLFTHADVSLKYYQMVEEEEKNSRLYCLNVAYLQLLMGNFEACEASLNRALVISPEDAWVYFRFAQAYLVQRRFQEALAAAQKSVSLHESHTAEKKERRSLYWTTLAQVLRLMNRTEEAVAVYRACREKCGNYSSFEKDVFETYLSASQWDKTKEHLAAWKKSSRGFGGWSGCKAIYHMAAGENLRRDYTLFDYKAVMDTQDYALVKMVAEAQKKNFAEHVSYREHQLQKAIEGGSGDLCHEYAEMALAMWYFGQKEAARSFAEKGLEAGLAYEHCYDLFVPIKLGSRAVCRALLGQIDEARRDIQRMEEAPLCSQCRFSQCKDRYAYAADVELVAGNVVDAKTWIVEGLKIDPSEESLLLCKAYIDKEGL